MERSVTHFEIYAEEPSQIPEFYRQIFRWRVERMPAVDLQGTVFVGTGTVRFDCPNDCVE